MGDVKVHKGPYPPSEARVASMNVNLLRRRQWVAVSDQPLEVERQRLTHIVQRLGHSFAGSEATRHGYTAIAAGILMKYNRKFHGGRPLRAPLISFTANPHFRQPRSTGSRMEYAVPHAAARSFAG